MIILLGLGSSLLVFLILFWFFSNTKSNSLLPALEHEKNVHSNKFTISSKDIETIAGEDVLTTQLDLARAYIETERKNLAKSILSHVVQQGSGEQKEEAKRLLESLHRVS